MNADFLPGERAADAIGLPHRQLKQFRLEGKFLPGIHYVALSRKAILYCVPLIRDWIANQNDPEAHQRAIEVYRSALLGNQKRPVGRPRKVSA
ncbi:hypothetical protein [Gloeobacter kilaueensis]|uniref:Uncharacterized protein n=1 Tax=Gloeobacter kilaueensis (strain ATCC BAA-2537 / CCAP 1431/1 / ULC 316 / JS1) TaxID=1183438 RepID=U5QG25_GLOK1|nr:hypothetical protein [Gloeobacter kilaueensis]AGY56630.1 hypothetical protein GKIL_0383 [Gloeobacter kilaueensis JS1]